MSALGRLLELSIATTDILESYEFYRTLGFTGTQAGDSYAYRYGVLADGRIALGLHEADVPLLALTYVRPDLASHLPRLRDAGLEPSAAVLTDERLHEVTADLGGGASVRLVEARTFSPVEAVALSAAGWFEDVLLPVRDLGAAADRLERLGFVRLDEESGDVALTSDHLSIVLREGLKPARPALRFVVADLGTTVRALEARGIQPDRRLAAALGEAGGIALRAPEGTVLLVGEAPA